MALTLDVWNVPSESARRVGHPAPFPVELPEQLIRIYTFAGDLCSTRSWASGSSLVAAARLGRRYVGYDLDPAYVEIARARVLNESAPPETTPEAIAGKTAQKLAEDIVAAAGFTITQTNQRIPKTATRVGIVAARRRRRPVVLRRHRRVHHLSRWADPNGDGVEGARPRARAPRPHHPRHARRVPHHRPAATQERRRTPRCAPREPDAFFDAVELRSADGRAQPSSTTRRAATRSGPLAGFWSETDLAR